MRTACSPLQIREPTRGFRPSFRGRHRLCLWSPRDRQTVDHLAVPVTERIAIFTKSPALRASLTDSVWFLGIVSRNLLSSPSENPRARVVAEQLNVLNHRAFLICHQRHEAIHQAIEFTQNLRYGCEFATSNATFQFVHFKLELSESLRLLFLAAAAFRPVAPRLRVLVAFWPGVGSASFGFAIRQFYLKSRRQ